MYRQGFTLLEMMIVVAILGIMLLMAQGGFGIWQKKVQVSTVIDQIRNSLIRVQQQSVSAKDGKSWGIHFQSDRYIIFSGDLYDPQNLDNQVKMLTGVYIVNPDASLSDGTVGYSPNVIFEKFTGKTVNVGTITIATETDPNVRRSVSIGAFGSID